MSRNFKPEYLKKLRATEAPNGYKFDISNYLRNPDLSYDYPSFQKIISEDEKTETFRRVYYFKDWNGNGEYIAEEFSREKGGSAWQVVKQLSETVLGHSNRFSVKQLLSFCK